MTHAYSGIFRFPASTPPFTYDELTEWVVAGTARYSRKIGTTVVVRRTARDMARGIPRLVVKLYDTDIALIEPDAVTFLPEIENHHHTATREWCRQIASDNRLGQGVWSTGRRYFLIGYASDGTRTEVPLVGRYEIGNVTS
jgi:hypothetical protein